MHKLEQRWLQYLQSSLKRFAAPPVCLVLFLREGGGESALHGLVGRARQYARADRRGVPQSYRTAGKPDRVWRTAAGCVKKAGARS